MIDAVVPYTLPEAKDHSFFYIAQHIAPSLEAKMHRHEAWELYCVTQGKGVRMTGDTILPFAEGDVVLIPPSMAHYWEYRTDSVNDAGEISYLMVAFSPELIEKCMAVFPEIKRRLYGHVIAPEAIKFGNASSVKIKRALMRMEAMDELGRLSEMINILPFIFTTSDHCLIGKPIKIERDIRRMQRIAEYVMAHYVHPIALDDIAAHIGMNRSSFCIFFKRIKGMTFSQFVSRYRMETACELLRTSEMQVSEICYAVGFNDLPHFIRVFTSTYGLSPAKYRKAARTTAAARQETMQICY